MKREWMLPLVVGMLAACAALFTGCEDNGGDDALAGTGNSVVKGNVVELGVDIVGGAVPGARVYLEGTDIEGLTNADGRFSFSGVPAGTYILVVEYNGIVVKIEITVTDNVEVEVRDIVRNADGTVSSQIFVRPLNPFIDVTGEYTLVMEGVLVTAKGIPGPPPEAVMTLVQHGETITGTIENFLLAGAVSPFIVNGNIKGNRVNLVATREGLTVAKTTAVPATISITMRGKVKGDGSMTGKWDDGAHSGTWTATPE